MCDIATILTLGSWVIDEVCRQITRWTTTCDGPVTVAVNLSHRELWAHNLPTTITDSLSRHAVPARCLILEITGSVIMGNPAPAREIMARLRTLPVDALKIDGAFTGDLVRDDQTGELVRVIIEMSRVLGLEVVAECVETPEQASVLRSLGCGSVQGWLSSRAAAGTDAGALLGSPLSAEVASEAPCLG
jgi:EAL domain-containing protein (putative c-di-GMP-specific phosphodiesterase class I)